MSAVFRTRKSEWPRQRERVDLLFGNEEHHFVAAGAQNFRDRERRETDARQFLRMRSQCSLDQILRCVRACIDHAFFVQPGSKNSLPINVEEQSDSKKARGEIRAAVADERQRQALVRQERSRHADVDRRLQGQQRNDAAAEQQTKTILRVQRDHHSAHDDDDEEEHDEQTDAQTEFLADHRENEIGVRIGQVEHFLPAVAEAESFHSAAAPGDECLHLLQASASLIALRIHESREPAHALGHRCRDEENSAHARLTKANRAAPDLSRRQT